MTSVTGEVVPDACARKGRPRDERLDDEITSMALTVLSESGFDGFSVEMVAQRTKPMLRIGRTQLVLPPGAFLQATAAGEAILARQHRCVARGRCSGSTRLCDINRFASRVR